ncbi:Crp/Fnr family transcriptional regulator [Chryseobacterium sp. OV279]|uniref:Crp/Fnr family transcriptional regulator n=1 Tax=Chryseobacterium sp. OV279 TaxID=1500285 RepID=UPI000919368F|nr:Crp/Fnr family transcriptional regulator [Chryseobacterium sp. OV279]SHF80880.1 cAMP-binding domain of CRP or a regulatory subunit of cAMP-dependent protein kinases [Chryseobacterium sp. OV279]
MVISEAILFAHGAKTELYQTDEFIFQEGAKPKFYFQIKSGSVKLNNFLEDGKEFVHGFPFEGHCIGESYLFTDHCYAVNAVAVSPCEIIKLEKNVFCELLSKNTVLHFEINRYTADRLHFRYLISTLLSIGDPITKLEILLNHLKMYFGFTIPYSFEVPYTRHQLATLTGLRVETVIRAFNKMEKQRIIKKQNKKIYY